jgi:uncharacterized protein
MIDRVLYMDTLRQFINKPHIKILTGIRRSGKSSVLILLKQHLQSMNIADNQIIYLNFESFDTNHLKSASELYSFCKAQMVTDQQYYLLLDEIQEVDQWEKLINSISVDFKVDIYLTGSNSHMLSSDLATYLTGRFVEIPVFPLSFAEYLKFKNHISSPNSIDKYQDFENYLSLGGFPVIHISDYSSDSASKVVFDIYSSILFRDTVQRFKIRDIELLERVVHFILDNLGNTFSGKNVADYFKSQHRKVDINTVYNYLHALEGAFIIYRTPRYDLKGKEILKTLEKYYLADLSILHALKGFKNRMISGMLENLVFLELKRRGYKVYVGKLADKEIDFIAEKPGTKIYVQVAFKLENEQTVSREFDPLLAVSDNYMKYVVTMDTFWKESIDGVKHLHIADFLLSENY